VRRRLALVFAAAAVATTLGFAASTGGASAPECQGHARLRQHDWVNFAFSCGRDEPTGFRIRANHAIRTVEDPDFVYACERVSVREWECHDIHSGAPDRAHARLRVKPPRCEPDLRLLVKPRLNFDHWGGRFELAGPC